MSLPPTHVVVDGSNIATEGRSTPSLRQLDEAVRAFLAQYPHDICTVVVDATFEHRIDASERAMFEEAHDSGEVITPPAGTIGRGDKFLLEIADRSGATVFSNDSFQEFHGEYPWLFNNGRLIGGKAVPEVGWVFAFRSPVRGPRSRKAVKDAREPARGAAIGATGGRGSAARRTRVAESKAPQTKAPEPRAQQSREPQAGTPEPKASRSSEAGASRRRGGSSSPRPVVAVNAPMPFVQFIAAHPVGSTVEGEVVEFSSHGAYVMVGEARCYVPTKRMGDPAPRGPREVLNLGELRTFVVQALDAPRRGIDLALPGFEQIDALIQKAAVEKVTAKKVTAKKIAPAKRIAPARKVAAVETSSADEVAATSDEVAATSDEIAPTLDEVVATKTTPTKTTPTKTPARKAAAKKVQAEKAVAKKAVAKKAVAKKAVAKKTVAKKAVAKKATAPGETTKKVAAKKVAARKVPAKKAAAATGPPD